jgi:tellurite resistance protein TerC
MDLSFWPWVAFIALILVFLALDLGFFHRGPRIIRSSEAIRWSLLWCFVAVIFGAVLIKWRGIEDGLEFFAAYVVELSLSLDNVFAIAVIFTYFNVAAERQHRVLFWGVVGALVMRGLLIGVGTALILRFEWVLLILGAFLVLTGLRWALSKQPKIEPEKNQVMRIARKILPITANADDQRLCARIDGRLFLTPLALVLIVVETTDLLFALDSVPAVFGVTQKPFIVFTSNILAVIGLRSLYFVLARAMRFFRFLRMGLALVLIFVGVKMLISRWFHLPIAVSLGGVALIIAGAIVASVIAPSKEVV